MTTTFMKEHGRSRMACGGLLVNHISTGYSPRRILRCKKSCESPQQWVERYRKREHEFSTKIKIFRQKL
jgi:hypothetical protein